jgi:hypothetical protein
MAVIAIATCVIGPLAATAKGEDAPPRGAKESVRAPMRKSPSHRKKVTAKRDTTATRDTVATKVVARPGHPDFSGTWRLDKPKSVFGKIPGGEPKARTDVIVHREPTVVQTLYLDNGASRDTTVYRYTTDGATSVNKVAQQVIKSVVKWEGDRLDVESKTKLMLVFDSTLSERWALSSDGKTLIMIRHVTWPGGSGEQKLVFVRV